MIQYNAAQSHDSSIPDGHNCKVAYLKERIILLSPQLPENRPKMVPKGVSMLQFGWRVAKLGWANQTSVLAYSLKRLSLEKSDNSTVCPS